MIRLCVRLPAQPRSRAVAQPPSCHADSSRWFSGAVLSCEKEVGGDATLVVIFAKRKRAVPSFFCDAWLLRKREYDVCGVQLV